jgi:hypothetical protein
MPIPQLAELASRFIPITLANLAREYPNGLALAAIDADLGTPRELHPASSAVTTGTRRSTGAGNSPGYSPPCPAIRSKRRYGPRSSRR